MKLKNKKTGEIGILIVDGAYKFVTNFAVEDDEMNRLGEYNSLAELNEEWEDYEEPEEFWYINECGDVLEYKYDGGCSCPILEAKEIGNYFETREEAEKTVEKLKALKRLKDKGFRFERWFQRWLVGGEYNDETRADLDLLFGGEE